VKKMTRNRSHFLFSAVARVCVVFMNVIAYVETSLNFGSFDSCQSLNRSRILKFEKISNPNPGPDSKILEQERSRSLKM